MISPAHMRRRAESRGHHALNSAARRNIVSHQRKLNESVITIPANHPHHQKKIENANKYRAYVRRAYGAPPTTRRRTLKPSLEEMRAMKMGRLGGTLNGLNLQ